MIPTQCKNPQSHLYKIIYDIRTRLYCKSGLDGFVGLGDLGSIPSAAAGCPCLCNTIAERGECSASSGPGKRMFELQRVALVMGKDVINLEGMHREQILQYMIFK